MSINKPISCPITIIIFNRYENAHQVLNQVRKVQPPKLFIIADGSREHKKGEKELCEKARSIIHEVDWNCEVITNFSETNLGCKERVSTGLNWVFEQVEESIILEDDCLPSLSFFYYCEELLQKYKNDERIMMISGNNHAFANDNTPGVVFGDSYYFTRHVHIWGWATWKRAWKYFDIHLRAWDTKEQEKYLETLFPNKSHLYFWASLLEHYKKNRVSSWAVPWVFSVWAQNALSIAPQVNLVQNTGISADATHTKDHDRYSRLSALELDFPLTHPECIIENRLLDNREMNIRLKEIKRLPYPIAKWASQIKWFIKDLKK